MCDYGYFGFPTCSKNSKPSAWTYCGCNKDGSKNDLCHNNVCTCKNTRILGNLCSKCKPNHYAFPQCQGMSLQLQYSSKNLILLYNQNVVVTLKDPSHCNVKIMDNVHAKKLKLVVKNVKDVKQIILIFHSVKVRKNVSFLYSIQKKV